MTLMKNRSLLKVLFVVLAAGLLTSCMGLDETDPSSLSVPQVKTFEVKDNGSLVFELSASVDKSASSRVAECGFYYSKDKSMSAAERLECRMTGGSFSADLTLRDYGETFYVCAYISNGSGSSELSSSPKTINVRELEEYIVFGEPSVVSYDKETKKMSVRVSCMPKDGVAVTKWGFCYGTSEDVSLSGKSIEDGNMNDDTITAEIDDVPSGSSLYVRAYVCDGDNLAYDDAVQLHAFAVPTVTIRDIYDVTADCASVAASVMDDGGLTITSRGIVYVLGESEPTIENGFSFAAGGQVGDFTLALSDLNPNTLHSIRAYAQNARGVTYSERLSFRTKVDLPQVQTNPATSMGLNSAILNAKIVNDGGEPVSECGFYWSTNPIDDLSAANRCVCEGSKSSFSYELTRLDQNTKYYFKAFAVNSAGESTGDEFSFSTSMALVNALTLPDETSVYLSGIVVGVTGRGFLLSDEDSNMLYVYAGNGWEASTVNVGDYVQVDGTMTTYYDSRELTFANVSVIGKKSVPELDVLALTKDNVKDFIDADHSPCKISVEGRIVKDGAYYNILLGDECVVSPVFPVVDMEQYVGEDVTMTGYYLWTSTNSDNKNVVSFVLTEFSVDLGLNLGSPANCYIVSGSGRYNFRSVMGNSNASVGNIKSVEVLWESFGTSTTPNVGDLVKSVLYNNGRVSFRTAEVFREGNAVIAAKDASGKILWSWHIWLTDQPLEQVYKNSTGTMLDRNLGATSSTPGDVSSLGLFYQWGRKDPFLGSSSIEEETAIVAESTITWPSPVTSSSNTGNVEYATANPTTYIIENRNNYDWYYTGSDATDDSRWQSSKTIYDPCPAGWRVPDGGSNGIWANASGCTETFKSLDTNEYVNNGFDFSNTFGGGVSAIWYPAAGCLAPTLSGVGNTGLYWSSTPYDGHYASFLWFAFLSYYPYNLNCVGWYFRSIGRSVRCLKE